ncbi:hypothetical protein AVEN_217360-1 [Araneus ventricosus]|uniref:Uncharacterized protein n=1 Tax=Araneus ventricosus TaxID=182803 RepID=A0A4Y2S2T4_ARAVE|nr:hypothetical protein AVEN_217360-1 [Araneus ventricosus]
MSCHTYSDQLDAARNLLRQSDFGNRNGARVCPTGGLDLTTRRHGLPDRGARPAVQGDECNEIFLKFSPNYYLLTTVEYPVQKFSPTGEPAPQSPPLAPPLFGNRLYIVDARLSMLGTTP